MALLRPGDITNVLWRAFNLCWKGIFKDKTKYPTLTRMSYCQCRLRLVFSSIFKEFGWSHVALILDRSDLFSWTVGKNLEYGLRKEGLLKFVRELDGNSENESYHFYLQDASMYARGKRLSQTLILHGLITVDKNYFSLCNKSTKKWELSPSS